MFYCICDVLRPRLRACCGGVVFSFYLPHGLTIDKLGNFWMTDVAMHQVIKCAHQTKYSFVPECATVFLI